MQKLARCLKAMSNTLLTQIVKIQNMGAWVHIQKIRTFNTCLQGSHKRGSLSFSLSKPHTVCFYVGSENITTELE